MHLTLEKKKMKANGKIRWSMVKAQNVPKMYTVRYKHLLPMGHTFGQDLSNN